MASLQRSMARRALRDFNNSLANPGGSTLFQRIFGKVTRQAVPPRKLRNGKPKKKPNRAA